MSSTAVRGHEMAALVARLAGLDVDAGERAELEQALARVGRVRAWLDGREVAIAARLGALSSFPEKNLSDAERVSLRQASRVIDRAGTAGQAAVFGESLTAGRISGAPTNTPRTATSTTSSQSAATTTTPSTNNTGNSTSPPTAPSPSHSPTTPP